MGTRLLKGINTPTLQLGLGPKGHLSFVEGGGPSSYLVHHARAATPNRVGFEFGANLNSPFGIKTLSFLRRLPLD